MSFTSTLYLCPVLDLLLINVPPEWQAEVRLGLQEALVNAAKHGNNLDPNKTIVVRFTVTTREYSWVIVDQGRGFIKDDCTLRDSNSETKVVEEKSLTLSTITSIEKDYSSRNESIGLVRLSSSKNEPIHAQLPIDESENGRGFSILHHVFDYVHWNRDGTQLTLSKEVSSPKTRQPSIC